MLDFALQYPTSHIKQEHYETLEYLIPVSRTYVSRYDNTKVIVEKGTAYKIQETYDNASIAESEYDRYYEVTHKSENRLDIVAYEMYGYATYWWVIAMANDIIDPFNVKIGTVLRVPPVSALYETYNVLGSKMSRLAKLV